jgi:RNA polymerase sigma-70 factor (ECF subfamily)
MQDPKLITFLDGLFRYAITLSHDRTTAEDLVQETYLRALPAVRKLKPNSNVKSWLFTILRNIWLNQLRGRRVTQSTDDAQGENYEPQQPIEQGPHQSYVSAMEQQRVRDAIAQLPVHFREIILLREFEELPYEDIAGVLNCPIGTVMSRLARARVQLREMLSGSERFSRSQLSTGQAGVG